jgi:hypothetical protein
VIGIRLFNKEIGKGGSSLSSLADLIDHNPGGQLLEYLRKEAIEIVDLCDSYTVFFLYYEKLPNIITKEQIIRFKDELTFLR